jgi:hypothetical protein
MTYPVLNATERNARDTTLARKLIGIRKFGGRGMSPWRKAGDRSINDGKSTGDARFAKVHAYYA